MGTSVNDLVYVLVSVLGFERESGKDHVRFTLRVNGRIVARTKYSHSWRGNKQLGDGMLSLQAAELHCSNRTLKGLLQNRLGKEDYFRELLINGRINQAEFDVFSGRSDKK
jgi:hypothetical protein